MSISLDKYIIHRVYIQIKMESADKVDLPVVRFTLSKRVDALPTMTCDVTDNQLYGNDSDSSIVQKLYTDFQQSKDPLVCPAVVYIKLIDVQKQEPVTVTLFSGVCSSIQLSHNAGVSRRATILVQHAAVYLSVPMKDYIYSSKSIDDLRKSYRSRQQYGWTNLTSGLPIYDVLSLAEIKGGASPGWYNQDTVDIVTAIACLAKGLRYAYEDLAKTQDNIDKDNIDKDNIDQDNTIQPVTDYMRSQYTVSSSFVGSMYYKRLLGAVASGNGTLLQNILGAILQPDLYLQIIPPSIYDLNCQEQSDKLVVRPKVLWNTTTDQNTYSIPVKSCSIINDSFRPAISIATPDRLFVYTSHADSGKTGTSLTPFVGAYPKESAEQAKKSKNNAEVLLKTKQVVCPGWILQSILKHVKQNNQDQSGAPNSGASYNTKVAQATAETQATKIRQILNNYAEAIYMSMYKAGRTVTISGQLNTDQLVQDSGKNFPDSRLGCRVRVPKTAKGDYMDVPAVCKDMTGVIAAITVTYQAGGTGSRASQLHYQMILVAVVSQDVDKKTMSNLQNKLYRKIKEQ